MALRRAIEQAAFAVTPIMSAENRLFCLFVMRRCTS